MFPPPPPAIVHSSVSGLAVAPATVIEAWQHGPGRINTNNMNSCPCDWYWVSAEWVIWLYDIGQPCPFVDGWSYRSAISNHPRATIKPEAGDVMYFAAVTVDSATAEGAWIGPCDWSLDGAVDSRDLFVFLDDFLAGRADFNLDGRTDSGDLWTFLDHLLY